SRLLLCGLLPRRRNGAGGEHRGESSPRFDVFSATIRNGPGRSDPSCIVPRTGRTAAGSEGPRQGASGLLDAYIVRIGGRRAKPALGRSPPVLAASRVLRRQRECAYAASRRLDERASRHGGDAAVARPAEGLASPLPPDGGKLLLTG